MVTATILSMPTSVQAPETPVVDGTEARWAANQMATLIRQVGVDSVAGMVLRRAQAELRSLSQAAEPSVVGPFRVRVAA